MAQQTVAGEELAPVIKNGGLPARIAVYLFVFVPLLALLGAWLVALHGWFNWQDVPIVIVFYTITNGGVGAGWHRYFTHGSFKAKEPLRIALAIAGSLAVEGPLIGWVAVHRRHHKYSDHEGDPHSPWRYGTGFLNVAKGFWFAHIGWMLGSDGTSREKFAPDLLKDHRMKWISDHFPLFVVATLALPAGLAWLTAGMTLRAFIVGFFWAGLVRMALMHHVTWSINSVCHMFGEDPFQGRDHSRNVRWLAIPSFGESWHNLHHVDPTCARHGVLKHQIDINAWFIARFERLRWAYDVRWPSAERIAGKLAADGT